MLLWNQHILICICRSIKGFQRQIRLLGNVNHYKWNLLRLNWFTSFLLVIKRSAIINWTTIISLSSDMLPIPAHNVSRAESWIHSDASCVIWQRSGALVTPHLIKRNWLWRSSCRPSSVGLAQDDGPDFATPANTPRSEGRAGEMKYWYCQFIALKHNGEQKALSSARNVSFLCWRNKTARCGLPQHT